MRQYGLTRNSNRQINRQRPSMGLTSIFPPHKGGPKGSSATFRLLASRSASALFVPLLPLNTAPSSSTAPLAGFFSVSLNSSLFLCSPMRSNLSGSRHFLSFLTRDLTRALASGWKWLSVPKSRRTSGQVWTYRSPEVCHALRWLLVEHLLAGHHCRNRLLLDCLAHCLGLLRV